VPSLSKFSFHGVSELSLPIGAATQLKRALEALDE